MVQDGQACSDLLAILLGFIQEHAHAVDVDCLALFTQICGGLRDLLVVPVILFWDCFHPTAPVRGTWWELWERVNLWPSQQDTVCKRAEGHVGAVGVCKSIGNTEDIRRI